MKLGIRKVIIASSETTYGVCFAEGDKDFQAVPARGGLRRRSDGQLRPLEGREREDRARVRACATGADIYALRIGNVIEPHEYAPFPGFVADPPSRKRNAWSYIDARDLGADRPSLPEKDGLGFQVFNAVNDTITAEHADRGVPGQLVPRRAGHAAARRVRGASLQPQDPRGARLQGAAQLARRDRQALAHRILRRISRREPRRSAPFTPRAGTGWLCALALAYAGGRPRTTPRCGGKLRLPEWLGQARKVDPGPVTKLA